MKKAVYTNIIEDGKEGITRYYHPFIYSQVNCGAKNNGKKIKAAAKEIKAILRNMRKEEKERTIIYIRKGRNETENSINSYIIKASPYQKEYFEAAKKNMQMQCAKKEGYNSKNELRKRALTGLAALGVLSPQFLFFGLPAFFTAYFSGLAAYTVSNTVYYSNIEKMKKDNMFLNKLKIEEYQYTED